MILNPTDRGWMPCLGYGVDSSGKGGRDAGINGFWYRHVGETLPRTIATPTLSFGFGMTNGEAREGNTDAEGWIDEDVSPDSHKVIFEK